MVDDSVHEDIDTGGLAPVHHLDELLPVARPALQLVADRLVPGPPLAPWDVLHGRGDLHPAVSLEEACLSCSCQLGRLCSYLGSKVGLTFLRYVSPGPLEQVDDDLSVSLTPGVGVALGCGVEVASLDPSQQQNSPLNTGHY